MKNCNGMKLILPGIACALLLLGFSSVFACTALRLTAEDGGVVVGRTMEFGFDPESDALVVPAGTKLTSTLADKSKGIHYVAKYGFVGANFKGLDIVLDGVNEKGLYIGGLYLPGYSSYPENSPQIESRALAPEDYGTWLLANFANVEEVKAGFDKAVMVKSPNAVIGGITFPGHFLVTDASGASVVIEPIDEKLVLFENPLGVLTNSPTFDWHMTNINNYVNLRAANPDPIDFGDKKVVQLGQGAGMLGLPGDYTPPSRFIRAVAFSQTAVQLSTTEETVLQMFHIMNAFDIPLGAITDTKQKMFKHDYTIWTSVSDLKNIHWAFKTYKGQSIRSIDVRKAVRNAGNKVKFIEMDSEQSAEDVSTKFK